MSGKERKKTGKGRDERTGGGERCERDRMAQRRPRESERAGQGALSLWRSRAGRPRLPSRRQLASFIPFTSLSGVPYEMETPSKCLLP